MSGAQFADSGDWWRIAGDKGKSLKVDATSLRIEY
jgi:hypothetical protein